MECGQVLLSRLAITLLDVQGTAVDFRTAELWGFVRHGTYVTDRLSGERFVVEPATEIGFLRLRHLSGAGDREFEVLDRIDHARFAAAG